MNPTGFTPSLIIPLALALTAIPQISLAQAEFDETKVLIEINATDGDIGFHALYDAGAWWKVFMWDPNGKKLLKEMASGPLRQQGLTENFFESAEPLCKPSEEDPEELVVTLDDFLGRFPAGDYLLYGRNNDKEELIGSAELTYNIPAAPDISEMDDAEFDADEDVLVEWAPGDDLGECAFDHLVPDVITPLDEVDIVAWEVVIEPDYDEDEPIEACNPDFERKFTAQLPLDTTEVTVSPEFMASYTEAGCFDFKFEIGSIEDSGNQTFSEGSFSLEED